jgi:hypothetical protein
VTLQQQGPVQDILAAAARAGDGWIGFVGKIFTGNLVFLTMKLDGGKPGFKFPIIQFWMMDQVTHKLII